MIFCRGDGVGVRVGVIVERSEMGGCFVFVEDEGMEERRPGRGVGGSVFVFEGGIEFEHGFGEEGVDSFKVENGLFREVCLGEMAL